MTTKTANLLVRLVDGVSGPAARAAASLSRLLSASNRRSGSLFAPITASANSATRSVGVLHTRLLAVAAAGYGMKAAMNAATGSAGSFETTMLDAAQKADLNDTAMEALGGRIRKLARDVGAGANETAKGFDTLLGAGLDATRAEAIMPAIMKSARAYNAEINDLAKAGFAALDNLKLPANEFARALDIMAQSGKEGRFELRDMAQYFPMLTASASALGMTGTTGVSRLSAALQIAMKGAGDASSAATNTANLMQKIISPETTKKFQKHGIDIRKELKKVQKDGGDVFEFIAGAVTRALGGDMSKLGDLFEDAQVQQFLRPLISNLNEYRAVRDKAFSARGVVDADYARRMGTFQAATKNFSAALEELRIRAGRVILPGLTGFMQSVSAGLDSMDTRVSVFDRLGYGVQHFARGLGLNLSPALERIKTALFGSTETFDSDLKALSETMRIARQAGEAVAERIERLRPAFASLGSAITEATPAVSALIDKLVELMGTPVGEAMLAINRAVLFVAESFVRVGGQIAGWAVALIDHVERSIEAFGRMGEAISSAVSSVVAEASSLAGKIASAISSAASTLFAAGGQMIQSLWDGMKAKFAEFIEWVRTIPSQIVAAIGRIDLSGMIKMPSLPSFLGGAQKPAQPVAGARAEGGPVSAGKRYLVGEKGPELFTPGASGSITPNGASGSGARAGNIVVSPTFNISGADPKEIAQKVMSQFRESVSSALRESHRDVYSYG
jgi:TP901 family phage tail tape measure protein